MSVPLATADISNIYCGESVLNLSTVCRRKGSVLVSIMPAEHEHWSRLSTHVPLKEWTQYKLPDGHKFCNNEIYKHYVTLDPLVVMISA